MWGTREVLERLERLSRRFQDMNEFVSKELQNQRDKIALLEKEIVEIKWVKHRVKTLDSQVNDLMNENVDLRSHLRAVEKKMSPKEQELKIYRDEERGGYVLKEKEEDWTLLPRLGDLVVNIEHGNDIRRVFENHYGFMFVGKDDRTIYARNQLKDSLKEWKVIARKEDLK